MFATAVNIGVTSCKLLKLSKISVFYLKIGTKMLS